VRPPTENDVVSAVERHFERHGYTVRQVRRTTERGTDVVAAGRGEVWYVEAKGGTSSKPHTRRFGKPFNLGQINSHVSRALFTAMTTVSNPPDGKRTRAAIALPDDEGHQTVVGRVAPALRRLGIRVLWVTSRREVRILGKGNP
jgi:hypothetical protein